MSGERTPGQLLGRSRREGVPGGRPGVRKVRTSPEEEAELLLRAGRLGVSVQRLLVESALAADREVPAERRQAMRDLFALRRQCAGVATNLNQLARQANTTRDLPVVEVRELLVHLRDVAGPGGRIDQALDALAAEGVGSVGS